MRYALVTGLLTAAYVGLVLLAAHVFESRTTVAVAASTLTAAVLFNLPRRRLQRAVSQRCTAWYDTARLWPRSRGELRWL